MQRPWGTLSSPAGSTPPAVCCAAAAAWRCTRWAGCMKLCGSSRCVGIMYFINRVWAQDRG